MTDNQDPMTEAASEAEVAAMDSGGVTAPGDEDLAVLAGTIRELGLEPEGGEWPIAATASQLLRSLHRRYEGLEGDLKVLATERDALKARAAKASKAAKVALAATPDKPRTVGEMPLGSDKAGKVKPGLSRDRLRELIAEAESVEIAFSDGYLEIAALAPLAVSGDAWADSPNGLKLTVPELLLHGPGVGQQIAPLAGYALLIDGKQVAYAPRPEPLNFAAGTTYDLKDDVIFPG